MTEIEKIRAKIASADFRAAIQALKSLAKGGSEENDVIQLEARFNRNERANRQDTLSTSEYNLECNKISKALLEICAELGKVQKPTPKVENVRSKSALPTGYCIRTKTAIPFNIDKPFCKEAFDVWVKFEDEDYPEKYCHFSGEPSNGETSFAKPILRKNWKKAKDVHGF